VKIHGKYVTIFAICREKPYLRKLQMYLWCLHLAHKPESLYIYIHQGAKISREV